MKKLVVILSMVLFSSGLIAQSGSEFVKTNEGTHFFKKVKISQSEGLTGIKANGEKMKFDQEDVIAYMLKGDYFQKMPVYENNENTGEKDFMKLVESKKGMVLLEYKYTSTETGKKATKFFVFKDQKLVVEMDEKNRGTLASFFDAY